MKLSEELGKWRIDRPDEWKMDEFQRKAEKLEAERDTLLEKLAQKQQLISEMDQLCLTVGEVNEIRAEAIADAVNAHPEKVAYVEYCAQTNSKGMQCDLWLSSSDLINYANRVRQGGDV